MLKHRLALTMVVMCLNAGCTTPRQMQFDSEVDRLCALDGGTRVFETIPLSANELNEFGYPKFQKFNQTGMDLGPDYSFSYRLEKLRAPADGSDGLTLFKRTVEVSRIADGRILGRSIRYSRLGGDIAALLPSGHSCADSGDDILKQIFPKKVERK